MTRNLRPLATIVTLVIAFALGLAALSAVLSPTIAPAEPADATQVETCSGVTNSNAIITCTLSPALPTAPEHVDVVINAPTGGIPNTPVHASIDSATESEVRVRIIGSGISEYPTHYGLTAYRNGGISLSLEAIDTTP
jgi:hypothetical protein